MTRIATGCALCIFFVCSPASAQKADAQKTLRSFGDFVTGGSWTRTNKAGEEVRQEYAWFGKNRFIRVLGTTGDQPSDFEMIIGIDPEDDHVKIWALAQGVRITTMTPNQKGIWELNTAVKNDAGGDIVWKGRFVRVQNDELRLETVSLTSDGTARDTPPPQVWKRK